MIPTVSRQSGIKNVADERDVPIRKHHDHRQEARAKCNVDPLRLFIGAPWIITLPFGNTSGVGRQFCLAAQIET